MKRLVFALAAAALCLHGQAGWYNAGWQYRKAIAVPQTRVLDTPPLYYDLCRQRSVDGKTCTQMDPDVVAHAQANCADVLFTASDGVTKLAHSHDDPASPCRGQWVGSALNTSTDSVIYMYYGNPTASDQSNHTGVWDSAYKGVYHGNTLNDDTSNGNNCTVTQGSASYEVSTSAPSGVAMWLGGNAYLTCPTLGSFSSYSIEFWVKGFQRQGINGKPITIPTSAIATTAEITAARALRSRYGFALGCRLQAHCGHPLDPPIRAIRPTLPHQKQPVAERPRVRAGHAKGGHRRAAALVSEGMRDQPRSVGNRHVAGFRFRAMARRGHTGSRSEGTMLINSGIRVGGWCILNGSGKPKMEIVGRLYLEAKYRPLVVIREIVRNGQSSEVEADGGALLVARK